MNLTELVGLIHQMRGGGSVTITSINTPDNLRGGLYGVVTAGMNEAQSVFHDEEELRVILRRYK